MQKWSLSGIVSAGLLGFSAVAMSEGDVIQIPLAQQGDNSIVRPAKGMTKAAVEQKFGAAESRQGPIGEPPITRWQYPEFVVMFEYDHVVHTVLKHKPKTPINVPESIEAKTIESITMEPQAMEPPTPESQMAEPAEIPAETESAPPQP